MFKPKGFALRAIGWELKMPPLSVCRALQLAVWSLPENHYKHDDEDKDAKRDIHNMLSLLMMVHPSPFPDYQA